MVDWRRGINLLRNTFRRLNLPKYWHKNSPKTYQLWQHGTMLTIFRKIAKSYSLFVELLPITKIPEMLGLDRIPDEGTLCKEEKRLKPFLETASVLIILPLLPKSFVAGADMTGLQIKRASSYYIHRINEGFRRKNFARLELVVWKKYILGWEIRLCFKDELEMLKSLWKKLRKQPTTLLYDKKGDSEMHHEWLESLGVRSIAPLRKGAKHGRIRKKLLKHFPQKTYNKRNRNENVNYVFKEGYGDSLKSTSLIGKRAEIASKILSLNLWARLKALLLFGLFNDTRHSKPIYLHESDKRHLTGVRLAI